MALGIRHYSADVLGQKLSPNGFLHSVGQK